MSAVIGPVAVIGPRRDERVAARMSRRRHRGDRIVRALCILATVIGLGFLLSILWTLLSLGLGGLSPVVFTNSTSDPERGLLNAIVGSLIQAGIGTLIGTPVGIMVGTYLSEYARGTSLGGAVRFVSDVLLSAPSILIGLFTFTIFNAIRPGHAYSGFAGGCALAVIVIPIVIRTTEDMLRLIPVALREAAMALGASKWKSIVFVCYRAALSGIATGVLLAIARVAGETAPLLFTSFGNDNWSTDLGSAMASLPVAIYKFAVFPDQETVRLAWVGALLITFGVLALNVVARVALRTRR